ncbi:hypothetical protein BSKO_07674 [Bryopsis sp. KO-2023]|nr:hypothetical protein BSKO_07674 [Bryopsis sp. KO-2023]
MGGEVPSVVSGMRPLMIYWEEFRSVLRVPSMLRFFLGVLFLSAITLACSPIRGWKPKTPLELAALAEVVVGGTVVETGDSVPCEGEGVPIYTYSATIQVDCVHKGNVVCTSGTSTLVQRWRGRLTFLKKGFDARKLFGAGLRQSCTRSGSLEMGCQITADGFGDTAACLSHVDKAGSYYFFLTQHKEGPCNGTYAASYNDIHGAAKPTVGVSSLC